MIDHQCRFAWYELVTTDVAGAKTFYHDVVGWNSQNAATPAFAYDLFTSSNGAVAGLMELPEEGRRMGATPRWVGYVAVDDIDATADRLRQLGGTIYLQPTDSNIGRISIVADAQAANFALVGGLKPQRQPVASDVPGQVGWHELLAADSAQAFVFYSQLFGWKQAEAAGPKSAVESYQLFAADGVTMGGIFTKFARAPFPFWLYYFNVDDVAQATARVRAGGGQVAQGPTELPDGSWVVRCIDPQGAMFALQGNSSERVAEHPAAEVGWSTEWGGFVSRGKVVAAAQGMPNAKSKVKSNTKSNVRSKPKR
jgi:predicted enzyme related to lactoylglutathione lyase